MNKCVNNKRIFTLAWEFPPITSGESVVCLRTLKFSRYYYDVCCGQSSTSEKSASIPQNIRNYSLKGKYILWPLYAAMLFRKLDKVNNYQIIMSRVMPPNGHMAGLLIKLLKPKLKWAVYFSDPIWNSPFIRFSSLFSKNEEHRPNYLLMKLLGIPSKLAIHFGDIFIFNNERLARYVLGKKYEKVKNRVVIAPYGHEGVSVDFHLQKLDKIMLAHVGQVYGDRNLKVLVSAVEMLKKQSPQLYKRLKIQQVGFVCDEELKRIEESNVAESFEIIGQVDYKHSIQYMKSADYLLVIDPCFESNDQNIYVPAKIFDYMSTGKPIIAIADGDSATADIMVKIKSKFVSHNVNSVFKMLSQILRTDIKEQNLTTYEQFHCKYGTKEMDDFLEKLYNNLVEDKSEHAK